MKYIIPIKDYEALIQRGKDIASKIATTPKEQYYENKSQQRTNRKNQH